LSGASNDLPDEFAPFARREDPDDLLGRGAFPTERHRQDFHRVDEFSDLAGFGIRGREELILPEPDVGLKGK
jgi:hypothetical protein